MSYVDKIARLWQFLFIFSNTQHEPIGSVESSSMFSWGWTKGSTNYGNLPLQVADPFSERLATLAWKKLDNKQNQNTIDIILFIIITTCLYFDQQKDSQKRKQSILIVLYMLYMFLYPLFWCFDIFDILISLSKMILKRKSTQSITSSRSPLSLDLYSLTAMWLP